MNKINENLKVGASDETTLFINVTEILETTNITKSINDDEQPISVWIIAIFFIILSIGTCINAVFVFVLLRSRRNGILSLILQLASVDTAIIYVAVTEIWNVNKFNWVFTSEICQIFSGTETILNTLSLYLIICLNFHVISLWNLHAFEVEKSNKNPLTSCNDSDSNECLVTRSENSGSNRNVTIDYRRRRNDVSVIFPTILIWFITLSLSVPEYTLSSTLKIPNKYTLCAIIDVFYGKLLHNLLLLFRVIIPLPLLLSSFLILIVKYCYTKFSKKEIQSVLTKKSYKIESLLLFSIILNLLYILTSFQRNIYYFLHVFKQEFNNDSLYSFRMPPLHNILTSNSVNTYLCMLHYSSAILRSMVYLFLLPKFKFLVKSKILCTNRKGAK